jgi:putative ABC transport system permease protein
VKQKSLAQNKRNVVIRNYFITAWRNIWKYKAVSFINIGGLAIGIAAVILIAVYIQSETSYDHFHSSLDTIYRVGFSSSLQDNPKEESSEFTAPFSEDAQKQFPEILDHCRVSGSHEAYATYGEKSIKTSALKYTDDSFFRMFSFKIISGNPQTALQNPYSLALSKSFADRIFGKSEAVGKTILIDGKTSYLVTAVSEDVPSNSTIKYEAVASISTLYHDSTYFMDWNGGWQYSHYLQLKDDKSSVGLEKKFKEFMWANFNQKYTSSSQSMVAHLQPMSKIHLLYDDGASNTRTNIYVFSIIALLILIISCINYINLSVARASSRFKEVGVRKVFGALRMHLVKQFMGETFLISFISLLLAVFIALALFPVYQDISGSAIHIEAKELVLISGLVLALMLIISLSAGGYLAVYLSSLNTVNTFRMKLPKSGKQILGNILIVLQFVISTALITTVMIVQFQMRFIKNKPLGFDKDQIVVVSLTGSNAQQKAFTLKQQIDDLSYVACVSAMSEVPYDNITQNGFLPEGRKDYLTFHQLDADENLLKTLNIHLLAGSYFSDQHKADADGYIINQALADKLGWKEPLGKTINRDGAHKVIGVVQNFHFASMHDQIAPLIITNKPWQNQYSFLAIKYKADNPTLLVSKLQAIWKQNIDSAPFDYWFLDTAFDTLYKSEQKFQLLFFCFSVLSVVLSLAGVFGLILLNIQYKTKEIGIRKVLGASMADIIKLSARKFMLLILLASAIAFPAAWFYSGTWLQDFAYRITVHWWMFALSGIGVLLLAFLVISLQTLSAAKAKPINSLRTE